MQMCGTTGVDGGLAQSPFLDSVAPMSYICPGYMVND